MGVIKKAVSSVAKAVGLAPDTPQIVIPAATAPTPVAVAQPAAVAETAPTTSADTETGLSTKQVNRKGKKALTVRRSAVGGGSGLNL